MNGVFVDLMMQYTLYPTLILIQATYPMRFTQYIGLETTLSSMNLLAEYQSANEIPRAYPRVQSLE